MTEARSTQVHRPHPERVVGTSLLYPHSRKFLGGLHTSGFVASRASKLSGRFDEPGFTTRCTVILSGSCSITSGGRTHHFQARDLVLARTSPEAFRFENSAGFSALEIHVPPLLLEQMEITPPAGIHARSLELQDPTLKTARQLLGYLRTRSRPLVPASKSETFVGFGLAMTTLGYAFTQEKTGRAHLRQGNIIGLEAARQALLARFDQAPKISELAATCGLSPTRFKELFRQHFGCAPYTLYQAHRMEHACHLLQRKNVTETAMELGYSNVSHFSASFQKHFGCTPSKWQRLTI
ncbi:regulator protein PchR [Acetobacter pasteurianus NBRC 101655]|nr:regulator protein PchR [Acetobacter pasteurianus NBRC 101655]